MTTQPIGSSEGLFTWILLVMYVWAVYKCKGKRRFAILVSILTGLVCTFGGAVVVGAVIGDVGRGGEIAALFFPLPMIVAVWAVNGYYGPRESATKIESLSDRCRCNDNPTHIPSSCPYPLSHSHR
jgi:hypothetical protein